jgi:hypothetical protein
MKFKFIFGILIAFTTIGCNINTPEIPNEPSDTLTDTVSEIAKENGYDYIDLGLSVKWAICNVGAKRPEEFGDYFAWGETKPKSTYDWSTYKWCSGDYNQLTKYCTSSEYGIIDNKTNLEPSDDAATVNWGGKWRMPTIAEYEELRTKCLWAWSTQNGVQGYVITGLNKNSIFLPAAGYIENNKGDGINDAGFYLSNSIRINESPCPHDFCFNEQKIGWTDGFGRQFGYSIRPVLP